MLSSGCDVDECRVLLPERIRIALRHLSAWGIRIALRRLSAWGNPDGIDPDSLAMWDISHPEFRAPTLYIRISHIRMGEEDVSTSPVKHV